MPSAAIKAHFLNSQSWAVAVVANVLKAFKTRLRRFRLDATSSGPAVFRTQNRARRQDTDRDRE